MTQRWPYDETPEPTSLGRVILWGIVLGGTLLFGLSRLATEVWGLW